MSRRLGPLSVVEKERQTSVATPDQPRPHCGSGSHLQTPHIWKRDSPSTATCSCHDPSSSPSVNEDPITSDSFMLCRSSLSFVPTLFSPLGTFPRVLVQALYVTSDLCSVPGTLGANTVWASPKDGTSALPPGQPAPLPRMSKSTSSLEGSVSE